jgi:hypothetical protein
MSERHSWAAGHTVDVDAPYTPNEKVRVTVCDRNGSAVLLLSSAAALTLAAIFARVADAIIDRES